MVCNSIRSDKLSLYKIQIYKTNKSIYQLIKQTSQQIKLILLEVKVLFKLLIMITVKIIATLKMINLMIYPIVLNQTRIQITINLKLKVTKAPK